uniref:ascorbate ferrireductase (transmembrane) n=1 Tax=Panagrellus redivivus TaxID=6233 RepID=A0A7E4VQU2_PANRE
MASLVASRLIFPQNSTNFAATVATEHHEVAGDGISAHEKWTLTQVHGICFVIGWFFCVSVAAFGARHLRDLAPSINPFGLKIWFHLHRTLNILGALLMIVGLMVIFIAHDWKWLGPKPNNTRSNTSSVPMHTICGILSVIIAWIQPLNSMLRCGPSHPQRPVFNWGHRLAGIVSWLLAATTIAIACKKFGKRFTDSDSATGICAAFIAFVGACVIAGEVLQFLAKGKLLNRLKSYIFVIFSVISIIVTIVLTVMISKKQS